MPRQGNQNAAGGRVRFILPDGEECYGWRPAAARLGIASSTLQQRAAWSQVQQAWVVRPPRARLSDQRIADAYAETGSARKAAAALGCSWSLVAKRVKYLAAALLLALALATPASAAPWVAGLLAAGPGASWWYTTGCTADPVVVTDPPGLGGGYCSEAGNGTAYANAGWRRVWVDGALVGARVYLPGVSK